MKKRTSPTTISFVEYVLLMALLMSLTALSIDTVLPILPLVGHDLHVANENDTQFMISFLFAGFSVGQIFYGPASDTAGRLPTLYVGIIIFILGTLISLTAQTFPLMLLGRFLQGIGVASPRVMSLAITRDLYAGRDMARVMSIIMAVFIFVPAIAPAIGQGIIAFVDWHYIFVLLLIIAVISSVWVYFRLPETLHREYRRPFRIKTILNGVKEAASNKITLGYTLCAGFIFGAFVGFLTSAQQIYQVLYGVGDLFALYFAVSALSIGVSSILNSMVVKKYGMERICHYALISMMFTSVAFIISLLVLEQQMPLSGFVIYAVITFFCAGLLFGNFNAIAMEPMGHIAGIASAFCGALSSAISVMLGTIIGQMYNGTLLPLSLGFLGLSVCTFITQFMVGRKPAPAL